ncbi:MAG: hypothetical protein Q7S20_08930 [Gemmatimonadaceae bacterium]|nr:hypothetical protein [Gemmatimonadaceae bacterium]
MLHAASCTLGVLSQSGKRVGTHVVETSAKSLIALLDTIPGRKHVCLEEGTMAGWLYEVLSPHEEEVVVAGVEESRGPKSDKLDAFGRAEELRIGAKERGSFAALGYRANVHDKVMRDSVRVMARITSLMRSRGVRVPHAGVYSESGRKKWIAGLPEAARYAAEILYAELDALMVLRAHAEKEGEGDGLGGQETCGVQDLEELSRTRKYWRRATHGGSGDALPVRQQANILELLSGATVDWGS